MSISEARLEAALSRLEIQDVMMRYARGVDRADEKMLKSCYHADAIEEHGSAYAGPAHAYIEGAVGRIRKMGAMAHYVCNIHIEFEGERDGVEVAYVEAYVLTFLRVAEDEGDWDTLTGGRVCDRFERRDGEWKIAHRKIVFDWNRDMPSNQGWCRGVLNPDDPKMVMATKGADDLSYLRF
ncbi:nuclear transport factor 2 family protein [Elongatibacter sediminis]|uniref:Nuclear transport factor 2 family protein n=1 Tax=Elongatibacter sediminis TaxID=3119006 RepID=A0AAW9RCS9_9GAMM